MSKQIAALAIAPEVGGDQPEALEDFAVHAEQDAAAGLGGVLGIGQDCRIIQNLEGAHDSANFSVEPRTRVPGELGDEIRSQLGSGKHQVGLIQLGTGKTGERRRQGDGTLSAVAADILVGILSRKAPQ